MDDESGDDDRDELRSGWGGESRREWWGWRNDVLWKVYQDSYSRLLQSCLRNKATKLRTKIQTLETVNWRKISDKFAFQDHMSKSRRFLEGSRLLGKVMSYAVAVERFRLRWLRFLVLVFFSINLFYGFVLSWLPSEIRQFCARVNCIVSYVVYVTRVVNDSVQLFILPPGNSTQHIWHSSQSPWRALSAADSCVMLFVSWAFNRHECWRSLTFCLRVMWLLQSVHIFTARGIAKRGLL